MNFVRFHLMKMFEVPLNEDVAKVIHMRKYTKSKKRLMTITMKTEEKKKEIFQNLQKLRRSVENITNTGQWIMIDSCNLMDDLL